MTRDKVLHWFYSAMLVIFIGCIIATVSINIAIKTAIREARKDTSKQIEKYDSLVVRPHLKNYNTMMPILKATSDSSLIINKAILKILKEK